MLRAWLFSLPADDGNDNAAALDFVDYTKASIPCISLSLTPDFTNIARDIFRKQCYLRLTTPDHALSLLKRLEQPEGADW